MCNNTGYSGRMGVHEVLPVTSELQRAISNCESADVLRTLGENYGYRTMQQDVLRHVLNGETSLSEARRLVFFDTVMASINAMSNSQAEVEPEIVQEAA